MSGVIFDGWSHLSRADNTSLRSLFLDHTGELPVLEAAIRRFDLPQGLGGAMGSEVFDCTDPINQSVLLSPCRTDPDRAGDWLTPPHPIDRRTRSPACKAARPAAERLP